MARRGPPAAPRRHQTPRHHGAARHTRTDQEEEKAWYVSLFIYLKALYTYIGT